MKQDTISGNISPTTTFFVVRQHIYENDHNHAIWHKNNERTLNFLRLILVIWILLQLIVLLVLLYVCTTLFARLFPLWFCFFLLNSLIYFQWMCCLWDSIHNFICWVEQILFPQTMWGVFFSRVWPMYVICKVARHVGLSWFFLLFPYSLSPFPSRFVLTFIKQI